MLKKIRSCLRKKGATAVIVAHEDEWQSEALPENKERLAYLTGFTGSAGLAFISLKQATLFVDSRYTLQAKKQTDFDVLEVPTQTVFSKWLSENLKKGDKVLYDAWCHTVAQIKRLSSVLEKKQASLIAYSNLVDDVWENKPAEKEVHIFDYPISLAGKTTKEKIDLVKKTFFAENFDAFVVCNPDTVSWLLNKRSDAVLYSPLYLKRIVVWKSGRITDFDDVNQKDFKNKIIAIDEYQTPMQIKILLEKMGAKVCHADNPFLTMDAILKKLEGLPVLVDFHAEATSEKLAMGYQLDGRVSAVWGTHTHVPTADLRILPKGTGYITDLGMTGPMESALGIKPEQSIALFRGDLTSRYQWANGPTKMEAVLFTIDTDTGLCKSAERWDLSDENPSQR